LFQAHSARSPNHPRSRRFDGNKVKVNLKMSVNRFNLLTQKKANLAKQQKRQVRARARTARAAGCGVGMQRVLLGANPSL